jgi:predicted dithiol-disulfide oxidoreductase (DUF899 family)
VRSNLVLHKRIGDEMAPARKLFARPWRRIDHEESFEVQDASGKCADLFIF